MQVTASNKRPSTTVDTKGAVDVDFTLTLDNGETIEGEVTLKLSGLRHLAWGRPDHWLDSRTLAALRDLPRAEYRAILDAIEAACSEVQS